MLVPGFVFNLMIIVIILLNEFILIDSVTLIFHLMMQVISQRKTDETNANEGIFEERIYSETVDSRNV